MQVRVGIAVQGRPGLVVDRPHGCGDFCLIRFRQRAFLSRDRASNVSADECLLLGPHTPTYIAGDPIIDNDFLHLSPDLIEPALRRFPVPLDRQLAPRSSGFLLPLLGRVQEEWVRRDQHWQAAVETCVTDLFLRLARNLDGGTDAVPVAHADRLREIRLQVHRSPTERWTVARMAALAHLQESQFSLLYRHLFGHPPIEDLLRVRLDLARHYLAGYDLTVSEIAGLCGFGDLAYFSRCFRRHIGIPPSTYRRQSRGPH